jgi:hypothetical protein
MIGMAIYIALVGILVCLLPVWPHSKSWGVIPCGGVGLFLIMFVALATGRL